MNRTLMAWSRVVLLAWAALVVGCTGSTSPPVSDERDRADSPPGSSDDPTDESRSPMESTAPSEFLRFVQGDGDTGRLETAVTRYRNDDGVEAILFAAVHIADASYYAQLESEFEQCDALLYELIAPEGTRPDPGRPAQGFISMFQRALKRGLALEFQLDGIDYHAANFVHADLSPEGFQAAQASRGESLIGLMFDLYVEEMKRMAKGEGSDVSLASLFVAAQKPDAARHMKLILGREMPRIERMAAGTDALGGGTAILTDRNIKCMEVFDEQFAAGKKRIGIFYGGAHMPDLETRVVRRGFRKVDERFLVAWDLSGVAD